MTQQMQQDELHSSSLKIADIVSYLHQNGWQQIAHPNERILFFQNGIDDVGKAIQLVLPSNNSFEDSPRLIAKAINLLAAVHEKSPQEIINSVAQAADTSSVKG